MKSRTWRLFLAFGLAATAVYFLLPNDERVTAANSAVLHYVGALAVVVGLRPPPPGRPVALVAGARPQPWAGPSRAAGRAGGHDRAVGFRRPHP